MFSKGHFILNDMVRWDIPTTIKIANIKIMSIVGIDINIHGMYHGDGVDHELRQIGGSISFIPVSSHPLKYDLDKTTIGEEIVQLLRDRLGFDVEYRAFLKHQSEGVWFE